MNLFIYEYFPQIILSYSIRDYKSKSSLILLLVLINCISLIPSINLVNPNFSLLLWMLFFTMNGDTNVKLSNLLTTLSSSSCDCGSSLIGVRTFYLVSSSTCTPLLIILLRIIGEEWFLIEIPYYWLFRVTCNGIFLGLPTPLLFNGAYVVNCLNSDLVEFSNDCL